MWFSNGVLMQAGSRWDDFIRVIVFNHLRCRRTAAFIEEKANQSYNKSAFTATILKHVRSVQTSSCLKEITQLFLSMKDQRPVSFNPHSELRLRVLLDSFLFSSVSGVSVGSASAVGTSATPGRVYLRGCGAVGGFLVVSRKFCRMDDTSCSKLFFLLLWNVSSLLAVDVASVLRQLK